MRDAALNPYIELLNGTTPEEVTTYLERRRQEARQPPVDAASVRAIRAQLARGVETAVPHERRSETFTKLSVDPEPQEIDEVDYFPMFVSSIAVGLVSVLGQIGTAAYFAFQFGASIGMGTWFGFIPFIQLNVDIGAFRTITMMSSVTTAAILGAFSTWAFVRRRRLQVKAGRLFAWANISLIGTMNLIRTYFVDDFATAQYWMWALVVIGLVGFAVGSYVLWVDYDDRRLGDEQ